MRLIIWPFLERAVWYWRVYRFVNILLVLLDLRLVLRSRRTFLVARWCLFLAWRCLGDALRRPLTLVAPFSSPRESFLELSSYFSETDFLFVFLLTPCVNIWTFPEWIISLTSSSVFFTPLISNCRWNRFLLFSKYVVWIALYFFKYSW